MIGQTLSHYRILAKLGEGGMGEVYLAEDTRLGRRVALKVLPRDLTTDTTAKARFVGEARAASALDHPNICTIHDIEEAGDGQLMLAMAFCDGESLKSRVARGRVSVPEAVDVAAQVADGLAEAHARGIVHRDIKPANVMVSRAGRVKIVDFGIARMASTAGVTATGTAVGTPGYMAPEQARGEAVDGRADLWALGVVLYEMLAGRPPFSGASVEETFYAVLHRAPEPLERLVSGLPVSVLRIVSRALTKDPVARYHQAEQMLADLQACREQLAHGARHPPRAAAESRPSIAVLPFANLSADSEQDYFCDGMTEELTSALSGVKGLRVVAHTSAMQFKRQALDIRRVGELLNVETVVEGSVRKVGSRLRVTAQLVNAADGYHLWSERYDRDLDDVFAVQDEIARAIVDRLKIQLLDGSDAPLVRRPTDNLEAYHAYLKGRYLWARRYSLGTEPAMKAYARAIELEPDFPAALAGLADCYTVLGLFALAPVPQILPKARALVHRALALDDRCAEAHHALGGLHMLLDWNWPVSDAAFTRALELNPDLSITRAYRSLALAWMGRDAEAVREADAAIALDPLSAFVAYMAGAACYSLRHVQRGIDEAERSMELEPHMLLGSYLLACVFSAGGRHDEAIAAGRRVVEWSQRSPFMVMILAVVLGIAGRGNDARVLLHELLERRRTEYVANDLLGNVFAAVGEWESALDAIERAVADKDARFPFLLVSHAFEPIRRDDRFVDILARIGYSGTSAVLLGRGP